MNAIIGVSLKMYFSHEQTLDYCRELGDLALGSASVSSGATQLVVMPQFPSLPGAREALQPSRIEVGAQDLAAHDSGAYTGEVSGSVLAEIGCRHVEVGHAERRRMFGETPEVVAAKTRAALRNGLIPWLCIGEAEQATPDRAAVDCLEQVGAAVAGATDQGRLVLAYEPHWAIGAPRPAPTEYIVQVCHAIRDGLADAASQGLDVAIVYGGSAGPGLLTELGTAVDGVFLGRFAHHPRAVGDVIAEAADRPHAPIGS
ncbi:MAG: triose-phosphate isomerase family protein [Actinomycetales bacterium]